jgi:aryl-alcohol dehydrogenase-like predicted oxidoreductase
VVPPAPIGVGCMRVTSAAPIVAALQAGATLLDTARAYGDSERLVAEALATWGGDRRAITVVTKGGMRVPGWIPDGRARTLRADAEASLAILGGSALDVLLLHAPDPAVPLATSVRALDALRRDRLARRIGLSNVNVKQLREALDLAAIDVVEAALSPYDDEAVRGGLVSECERRGILFLAHSPLGGPKRAARLDAAEAALVIARLRGLSPVVVPIPGPTRVETGRAAVEAARLEAPPAPPARPAPAVLAGAEVVLVMGPPASGKSSIARDFVERGFARLNRDELGGTLRAIAQKLAARLDGGERRFVLDNTYHTRASRHDVLEVARARGVPVRGLWLDAPLSETQVNAVERILDRLGELPEPDALSRAARKDPQIIPPMVLFRYRRELEPPEAGEGFAALETLPFQRRPRPGHDRAATVFTLDTLATARPEDAVDGRFLCIGWTSDAPAPPRADVDLVLCTHGGGPPRCWCRPPLPGALLVLVRRHRLDVARSRLVGASAAHRALAAAVGLRYSQRP